MNTRWIFAPASLALLLVIACGAKQSAGPLETGIEHFESGDYESAKVYFEKAREKKPQSPKVAYYLGRTALEDGDFDVAVDWLEKAVELDASDSDYHFHLGVAYAQKIQNAPMMEQAQLAPKIKDAFEKAVELDPANVDARMALVQYYLNAPPIVGGSPEKAAEQLDAIRDIDPRRAHMYEGRMAVTKKDYAAAEAAFLAAVELDPDKTDAYMQLGFCYQASEDYDKAFEAFEKIAALDPTDSAALYQIGRTAVFAGRNLERGAECLRAYLEKEPARGQPSWAHAHWRLGGIYEHMGDKEMARKEYEAALALDPDVKQAKEALEKLDE